MNYYYDYSQLWSACSAPTKIKAKSLTIFRVICGYLAGYYDKKQKIVSTVFDLDECKIDLNESYQNISVPIGNMEQTKNVGANEKVIGYNNMIRIAKASEEMLCKAVNNLFYPSEITSTPHPTDLIIQTGKSDLTSDNDSTNWYYTIAVGAGGALLVIAVGAGYLTYRQRTKKAKQKDVELRKLGSSSNRDEADTLLQKDKNHKVDDTPRYSPEPSRSKQNASQVSEEAQKINNKNDDIAFFNAYLNGIELKLMNNKVSDNMLTREVCKKVVSDVLLKEIDFNNLCSYFIENKPKDFIRVFEILKDEQIFKKLKCDPIYNKNYIENLIKKIPKESSKQDLEAQQLEISALLTEDYNDNIINIDSLKSYAEQNNIDPLIQNALQEINKAIYATNEYSSIDPTTLLYSNCDDTTTDNDAPNSQFNVTYNSETMGEVSQFE